jgi:hypothetical protein
VAFWLIHPIPTAARRKLMSNQTLPIAADVESIDAIIMASYRTISGPVGEKRDWDRMRSLFAPGARLIPTNKEPGLRVPDGKTPDPLGVEEFITRVEEYFNKTGFYEIEIARRTEQFGRIAHAFSVYESWHDMKDPEPFMRGINSIQLFYDGKRWWILNIFWQQENPDGRIPEKYLSGVR